MVFKTEFSYNPESNTIIHLLTNRIVEVTKNLIGPYEKQDGLRSIRGLNFNTDLSFTAKDEISVPFILDAIQWYIGYKDLDDLEICGV